jgi:hypothetical protein
MVLSIEERVFISAQRISERTVEKILNYKKKKKKK